MAIEWILLLPCEPKNILGNGDQYQGVNRLLDCLKAVGRANAIADIVSQEGGSLEDATITVSHYRPDTGTSEGTEVSYKDLLKMAEPLKEHEASCKNCVVNLPGVPFGCIGGVNYPITKESEAWIMDRLLPSDTVGGTLLLNMVRDFRYTGEPLQQFRAGGLFELARPLSKKIKKGFFNSQSVTSDQIFQALICIPEPLEPSHCMLVLLWFGAIALDGEVVKTKEQFSALNAITNPEERIQRTTLELGDQSPDVAIATWQEFLQALYVSWLENVPVGVSA